MKSTIEAMQEAGVRNKVKIMIGGAPITERFSQDIGADGFSDTASGAVRMARSLVA
jgi:5-methyltetrahydrofolate--homocysteine methyltransferase